MRGLLACLILLVAPLLAEAQVTAVISGPTNVATGDLVVLDASESEGLDFEWLLVNSDRSFLPVDDGLRVAFSAGKPGIYRFVLVVGGDDGEGGLAVDMAQWAVTIGDPDPEEPDDPIIPPDDPVDPPDDPVDPSEFAFLSDKVATWCEGINEPTKSSEAAAIAAIFEKYAGKSGEFENSRDFTIATSDEYKSELGVAAYASWSSTVFSPLVDELRSLRDAGKLETMTRYGLAWQAIADGFKEVANE